MFESIKRDEVLYYRFENFRLIIILEPDLEYPFIESTYTININEFKSTKGFRSYIINITEHGEVW